MSERFYVNRPLGLGTVDLEGPEAHHLVHVSRLRAGQEVRLFNGDGREYRAVIQSVGKHQAELQVVEMMTPQRELSFALTVACPLPRGDRGQFLIEKLTEVGVTAYLPLRTQRSVLHPGESRKDKLERYVQEACKQCGRNVLMQIGSVAPWDNLVKNAELPARRWLAHPGGQGIERQSAAADTIVAVGPEGGFTDEEVNRASDAGWQVIDLGPRILRVETAAVVLAAMVALQDPMALRAADVQ